MKFVNDSITPTRATDLPPAEEHDRGFAAEMLHSLKVSVIATALLAVLVSGIYPVAVWLLSMALFNHKANGSLIGKDGQPVSDDKAAVGSALIGQSFADLKYFHPRP